MGLRSCHSLRQKPKNHPQTPAQPIHSSNPPKCVETSNFRPLSPVEAFERTSLKEKPSKSFEDMDASVTETMSRISGQSRLSSVAGGGTATKPKKKKNRRAGSVLSLDEDRKKLLPVFIPILMKSSLLIGGAIIAIASDRVLSPFQTLQSSTHAAFLSTSVITLNIGLLIPITFTMNSLVDEAGEHLVLMIP
ncbi:hypothetical protein BLNAU_6435 [Blattamonas nauphoetae]|uniref:Uncharacterized protein n=1 Tax=Blattamonas nauphoetae TaxID=2049346 RepID=A0ABQ9Y4L1_9EUKA|nr:hypothetical protein BLNAU_6435 [Blattamonas nauphoetae]